MHFLVKKNTNNKRQDLVGFFAVRTIESLFFQVRQCCVDPSECLFMPIAEGHISLNGRLRSSGKVFIANAYLSDEIVKKSNRNTWVNSDRLIELNKDIA